MTHLLSTGDLYQLSVTDIPNAETVSLRKSLGQELRLFVAESPITSHQISGIITSLKVCPKRHLALSFRVSCNLIAWKVSIRAATAGERRRKSHYVIRDSDPSWS